jgi:hypothetical protein
MHLFAVLIQDQTTGHGLRECVACRKSSKAPPELRRTGDERCPGLPGATFNSIVENSAAAAVFRGISLAGPEVGTLEARAKKLHFLEGSPRVCKGTPEFPAEDSFE